jgi:hypothetical protein
MPIKASTHKAVQKPFANVVRRKNYSLERPRHDSDGGATMETGKPNEGWSMNMVAFVLSTIVTFIFWSLAVGNYRSEQRELKKRLKPAQR